MNLWEHGEGKYITETTLAISRAKFDLSIAKMDILKIENDLASIGYHLNLLISNIRSLRKTASIINIEEFRKIQREAIHFRNQQVLGKKLIDSTNLTVKQIEARINQLNIDLDRLRNNILEFPYENKRS